MLKSLAYILFKMTSSWPFPLGNSILRFGIPSEDRSVSCQENEGFSDRLPKAKSEIWTIGEIKIK
jgi:hypothetical protein